jgi:molybdopterin molybdotransferase
VLSVDDAQRRILERIESLDIEHVFLTDAVSRVLAEPIVATRELPAWDNSAMDGYAIRAADIADPATQLTVAFEVPAGATKSLTLLPGTAARIFTGAPLPEGADTVMIQENAARVEDKVSFVRSAHLGENVRRRGEDIQPGTTVFPARRLLSVGDINVLASLGRSQVPVFRRPRVAILTTGDELVDIDGPAPTRGQIVNSNAYALAAAVKTAGGVPTILPVVRDDYDATKTAFIEGVSSDVLLTCGGMSVGDYDYARDVLRELSGDTFGFWKVALKPGKPLGFGYIGACATFGLPGNPASTWVTFELFVRPALLRLQGHSAVVPVRRSVRVATAIAAGRKRTHYMRVQLSRDDQGILWATPSRTQSSGALSSIANTDAFAVVLPSDVARERGDSIDVLVLSASVDRHS